MDTEIKNFIINRLESGEYPLTKNCFGKYIKFLLEQNNYEDFDLFKCYEENEKKQLEEIESRFKALELLLEKTLSILGINVEELIRQFIPKEDLLKDQPDKFFDVLNELNTIIKLHEKGFSEVRRPNKKGADFVARYNGEKIAIEVKTIRPDKKIKTTSIPLPAHHEEKARIGTGLAYRIGPKENDNSLENENKNTLDEMLFEKINEILPRISQQLEDTAENEQCQKKLLALWIRKRATASLLEENTFGEIVRKIKEICPNIDYFIFNGYYWYPNL